MNVSYTMPRSINLNILFQGICRKKMNTIKLCIICRIYKKNSDLCRTCITPSEGPVCIQPEDAHLPQGKLQHVKDT